MIIFSIHFSIMLPWRSSGGWNNVIATFTSQEKTAKPMKVGDAKLWI